MSEARAKHLQDLIEKSKGRPAWNRGKTYVFRQKTEYANRGSWLQALTRVYGDKCMRCGWGEESCDAHHIRPKSKGGRHEIANGIILCPNCHRLADRGRIPVSELWRIRSAAVPQCEFVDPSPRRKRPHYQPKKKQGS